MIKLDPKIKFPMAIIGIISVMFVFYTVYSTTKEAVENLSSSLENCICDC
tara:strand:- start:2661 stop:2810 length:150 start_codon:yes stop_codon:yes gene_type:complete